jgi:hypothetical protein
VPACLACLSSIKPHAIVRIPGRARQSASE